ncbi:MAG TPA: FeoC-like transcriptional regulator [Aggregatilineales bacterium]|nr:FeoC-like transcriptional regulator [Aggregatilineales bacterium]HPV07005.1 FeoC-like transcriptional regulator [Aggregatilineales bacterium]HQA68748.1 FeoC-like transcriptional regulator [Aggregatilineales bacterium]HQE19551.1 FeoC-like transcriptional regulator [Aggregatilineales bacterium]
MSPLYAVLDAIKNADGPVSLSRLGRELDIEPDALQGMIDFWVRKGRLRMQGALPGSATGCGPAGCVSCPVDGPESCPVLLHMPRRYEVVGEQ